jgi:hypothetical protein
MSNERTFEDMHPNIPQRPTTSPRLPGIRRRNGWRPWLLERKNPNRWGRRNDDAQVPRVVVQIGVRDSEVQVNVTSIEVERD